MFYNAHVRNYRMIRSADLVLGEGVTIVAGKNQMGKTSLGEAIQAALTGRPLIVAGDFEETRAKTRAKTLLCSAVDAKVGSSVLVSEDFRAEITWPKCEYVTDGTNVPVASLAAAGVHGADLTQKAVKDRMAEFRKILGATPSLEDLTKYLQKEHSLDDKAARFVWHRIEELGWTGALQKAGEMGAELKGKYAEVTGQHWGKDKAETWMPEGWKPEWNNRKPEEFEAAHLAAMRAVEEATGQAAVDTAQRDALAQQVVEIPLLSQAIVDAQEELQGVNEELESIAKRGAELNVPDNRNTGECPHCGAEIWVVSQAGTWGKEGVGKSTIKLQKPVNMDSKEIEAARIEVANLDGRFSNRDQRRNELIALIATREHKIDAGRLAQQKLAETPAPDGDSLAEAQAALDTATAQLEMAERLHRGLAIHGKIKTNMALQETLGDTGVRAHVLAESIDAFNEVLMDLGKQARIHVAVSHEGLFRVNGRPYRDLSGSERLRARVLLQCATAHYDKSKLIVVDLEDSTDRSSILALIKMLCKAKMPTLLLMHAETPAFVPNLEEPKAIENGISGRMYWIKDGETSRIGAKG